MQRPVNDWVYNSVIQKLAIGNGVIETEARMVEVMQFGAFCVFVQFRSADSLKIIGLLHVTVTMHVYTDKLCKIICRFVIRERFEIKSPQISEKMPKIKVGIVYPRILGQWSMRLHVHLFGLRLIIWTIRRMFTNTF